MSKIKIQMLKSKISLDPEYFLGTEGQIKFKKQKKS